MQTHLRSKSTTQPSESSLNLGGGGEGGGCDGDGDGGADGGSGVYRRPQSSQSVPSMHVLPSAPGCPSWQCLLLAHFGPPRPKRLRQVLSHAYGGGADGGGGLGGSGEGGAEGGGGEGGSEGGSEGGADGGGDGGK